MYENARNLPKRQCTIQVGIDDLVPLLELAIAAMTLGVPTNTAGISQEKVIQIEKTGLDWVRKLKTNNFVKPSDRWLGFNIQFHPRLE